MPRPIGTATRRTEVEPDTGKLFLQVSKAPRYDIPKAAPAPLRLVQSFVNTVDLEHGREWLGDPHELAVWAVERRVAPPGTRFDEADLARAVDLREALRALLAANRDRQRNAAALAVLTKAAHAAALTVSFDEGAPTLESRADGVDGLCGRLVGVAAAAMLDGSWERLK